jgi:hypothetical protein
MQARCYMRSLVCVLELLLLTTRRQKDLSQHTGYESDHERHSSSLKTCVLFSVTHLHMFTE